MNRDNANFISQTMKKFNVNSENESQNGSQVTLTSYMIGENSDHDRQTNPAYTDNREKEKTKNGGHQNGNTVLNVPEKYLVHQNSQIFLPKPTVKEWLKDRARNCCTKKMLYKRVPILAWLPNYRREYVVSDFVAGLTVGLTVIPQAIAYASIAGLPPQIGLYSSFVACFVYTIFGSCKDSPIGPTAIAALLVRENIHQLGVDGAILLCFLSGCVELLMGMLQLGFLIDFISGPVSIGFSSAAAIIIATTQVKDLLGLKHSGSEFLQVWEQIFMYISETRPWDCVLGFSCLLIILLLRRIKDFQIGPKDRKDKSLIQSLATKLIWLICTSRNIIIVIVSGFLAYHFETKGEKPFILIGEVKGGFPPVNLPPFSTTVGNTTYNFAEMTSTFGSGLIIVPLLAILENIALAKVFSDGKRVDATQEMIAIGLCNITSSFFSSMSVTGALSRGAVNNASGVKTTLGGIYTGIVVLLSLFFLTPYFSYIPKASLAAVIIAAVIFMVELHVIKPMWKSKKSDVIPAIATFLISLFIKLEIGIVVGIGINVLFLLYASARPSVSVEKITTGHTTYLLVTPDRSLTFPSVDYVRSMICKAGVKQGSSSIPVVIDAKHIQGADFTAAKGIKSLIEDFHKRKQPLLFFNLKHSVINVFQGVQPKQFIYCETDEDLNNLLKQYSVQKPSSDV